MHKKCFQGKDTYFSNFTELVLGLSGGDPVDGESALHVVDNSEVLAGLFNLDNIHEPSGVLMVGSNPTVNLDVTVLKDVLDLLQGKGILQTVPKTILLALSITKKKVKENH